MVYTHNETLLSLIKEENSGTCFNTNNFEEVKYASHKKTNIV